MATRRSEPTLDVELVPVDRLQPHPENPRRGDVETIRRSIRDNGFYGVCVAQRTTGFILAGNHRFLAGVAEGMTEVPVHWLDCDDVVARRILVADNRTADLASYDERSLALLLESLSAADELAGTFYSPDDLAELLSVSGLKGEREAGFLDDFDSGSDAARSATEGGHLEPVAAIPRQLIITATPEERQEIVDALNQIRAEQELPTMTAALLWALRRCLAPVS